MIHPIFETSSSLNCSRMPKKPLKTNKWSTYQRKSYTISWQNGHKWLVGSNKNCCVVQIFSQSCNIFIPNDNLGTTINSCLFGFTIENRILGVSKFKSIYFQSDQNFWPRPEILCFFFKKGQNLAKRAEFYTISQNPIAARDGTLWMMSVWCLVYIIDKVVPRIIGEIAIFYYFRPVKTRIFRF